MGTSVLASDAAAWIRVPDGRPRAWVVWLALGTALRLVVLPLAAHPDLIAIYDRLRLIETGAFQIHDFGLQSLAILLHQAFAWLFSTPLPDFSAVNWPAESEHSVFQSLSQLVSAPGAMGAVALMKLPYVLCDLLCGRLIAGLVSPTHALAAFAAWMLNPVAIYACAIFGKLESVMLVPLLLGLISLQRGRTGLGFLWLGLAAAIRLYPLLLLPPMILAASADARRRCELAALAVAPLVWELCACAEQSALAWLVLPLLLLALGKLYLLVRRTPLEWLLLAGAALLLALELPQIHTALANERFSAAGLSHHLSYLLDAGPGRSEGGMPFFPLVYGVVLLWADRGARSRSGWKPVLDAALLATLAFFGLCFFHPQYAVLLLALVGLRFWDLVDGSRALGLMLAGLLVFLWSFPNGATTVRLFLPAAPDTMLQLPTLDSLLPEWLTWMPGAGLGRALVSLGGVWIAWELLAPRAAGAPGRLLGLVAGAGLWALAPLLYLGLLWARNPEVGRPIGEPFPVRPEAMLGQGIPLAVGDQVPRTLRFFRSSATSIGRSESTLRLSRVGPDGAALVGTAHVPGSAMKDGPWNTLDLSLDGLSIQPGTTYQIDLESHAAQVVRNTLCQPMAACSAREALGHALTELFGREEVEESEPWWASRTDP